MKDIMKEKCVRQFLFFQILFYGSGFFYAATYVTFLREKGLNLFEVNLVNTTFFLTLFICEIPTGAFADIFGRKKAIVLAFFLRGLSEILYGSSHTFPEFIFAEVIGAIGLTFVNGAFKAWLVDSLIHKGYDGVNLKIFGRAGFYNQVVGIPIGVLGAYIAGYSPVLPWYGAGSIAIIGAILAHLVLTEEYFVHQKFSWKNGIVRVRNIIVSSIQYGMKDRAVRFILIMTFVQVFAVQALNMYWQPFFESHGVNKVHFGFIFAGILLFMGLGSMVAGKTNTEGKERKFLIWSQIIVGILILLAATLTSFSFVIIFFLLHEFGRGYWEPLKDVYLHKRIPSSERATIDSFCSTSPRIGGSFGLLASGAIAQWGNIPLSWIVSALVLIFGALLIARNGGHKDA